MRGEKEGPLRWAETDLFPVGPGTGSPVPARPALTKMGLLLVRDF